jgi:hypothetical protein
MPIPFPALPSFAAGAVAVAATLAFAAGPADAARITGSGVARTETRNVGDYHAIGLDVHANVEIRQGSSEGVTITGDDNIVARVETVVDRGTLKIRWVDERDSFNYQRLDIVVNVKGLDAVALSGSGKIHADRLQSGKLRAAISGSGAIAIEALDADTFDARINGSGTVSAAGRADALDVSVAGSGDVALSRLKSRDAKIVMSGSGDAIVWASDVLNVRIAGSGDVRYFGKPKVNRTVAGSGRIANVGDAP